MSNPTQWLRLVYASRATFPAGADNASLNADVARILMQSRRNNPAQGLVGALYFADGCFFQCLEGPSDAVDRLYARLHQDPRHSDLKVLGRALVERPSFSGWSMKFVPNALAVRALLSRHGLKAFDPYAFSPDALAAMVNLLVQGADVVLPDSPPRTSPMTAEPLAVARRAQWLAAAALVVSLAAVGATAVR